MAKDSGIEGSAQGKIAGVDVRVSAKGLYVVGIFFFVVLVWSIRSEPQLSSSTVVALLATLLLGFLVGYVAMGRDILPRLERENARLHEEIGRISDEKTQLQEQLLNTKLSGSKKPKGEGR